MASSISNMDPNGVIEIDAILRPFSSDARAGTNLREDLSSASTYYRLKEARTAARAAERRSESGDAKERDAGVPAQWREVREICAQALGESTKDLELSAWLIEALCRLEGFAGLADGFRVARGLVESFWDELWPRPDEDGWIGRLAPITGLNGEDATGTLIAPIARIPITGGGVALATWHYQKAAEIARVQDAAQREALAAAAGVTLDSFRRAVEETPTEFYRALTADIERSIAEYEGLCRALEERCGNEAPPASNIRAALQSALDTVLDVAGKRLISADSASIAGANHPERETSPGPRAARAGALRSREEAFQTLSQVAEYFRSTEPHSPLSYVLDQAVRWGRLPLPALLGELIPDAGARGQFMKLTGIRAPEA